MIKIIQNPHFCGWYKPSPNSRFVAGFPTSFCFFHVFRLQYGALYLQWLGLWEHLQVRMIFDQIIWGFLSFSVFFSAGHQTHGTEGKREGNEQPHTGVPSNEGPIADLAQPKLGKTGRGLKSDFYW